MMQSSVLKWPDYLILAGFLVISLAIGLYHSLTGGKQKTTEEFIMANRRLQVIPTSISLVVSYMSAILVLGMTAETYSYGPQMALIDSLGFVVAGITVERILVPWLYPLKLVSVNEYFSMRFASNSVRLCTSLLGILNSIVYMGTSMYAPSAALESVTGLPLKLSIPIVAIVCMVYTALGGMRAVVWTDVFQFLTMIGGMLVVCIQGMRVAGGIDNVIKYAAKEGRMNLVDWNPDPTERHTFWGIMIGGVFTWIPAYGLSQAAVQRISATRSLADARLTILLTIPLVVLLILVSGFTGLAVVAYYSQKQCDPLANNEIRNENQLLPHFVMTIFGNATGFAGLFLATLYGGALSSVSSCLSGSVANFSEDILKGMFTFRSELKKAIVNRILVLVFGLLSVSVAFLASVMPGPITQISLAFDSCLFGPLVGIFVLGGASRLANWKGALTGAVVGLLFNAWLQIGSMSLPDRHPPLPPLSVDCCTEYRNDTVFEPQTSGNCTGTSHGTYATIETPTKVEFQGLERFYCLSYLWYVVIGMLTTFLVGMVVSLIFRDKALEDAVDERLLVRFTNCGWKSPEVKNGTLQPNMQKNHTDVTVELISYTRNGDTGTILST